MCKTNNVQTAVFWLLRDDKLNNKDAASTSDVSPDSCLSLVHSAVLVLSVLVVQVTVHVRCGSCSALTGG